MTTSELLLSTALKILFVLAVAVGAFAPGLVWAERRQSAMMQDRVGPHRAGIVLPPSVVDMLRASLRPLALLRMAAGSGVVAFAALIGLKIYGGPDMVSVATDTLVLGLALCAVAGALLHAGYFIHAALVANGGNISILGLLHPLADALKFIFKEDFVPPKADKVLHALAPIITLMPAVAAFAVIPFADTLYLDYWDQVLPTTGLSGAVEVPMQVASLNVGVLYIFAVTGTGIIGAAIAGYSSDNKYSLLGGVRAASQMVSYEVALGLTLVPCFMMYDSLRLEDMAVWQHLHHWGIVYPPLFFAFILYFTAATAEAKRIPFDLPEGESELVGGYLTEYSGMKFGMFFMSEFIEVVVLAALACVFFFGGWDVPFLTAQGWDLPGTWAFTVPNIDWLISDTIEVQHWAVIAGQVVAFLVKIVILIWFQLMIRWTLPRFRYDQVMALCWKGILPLSLANVLFTGLWVLY